MKQIFQKIDTTSNEFSCELAGALGFPGEVERTNRVFRSVLHALRNNLTIQESVEFLTQLPSFIKPIYIEGWSIKSKKKIIYVDDFLNEIWQNDGKLAEEDFENKKETIRAISIVFLILGKYISKHEVNDIAGILPAEVKEIITEAFAA